MPDAAWAVSVHPPSLSRRSGQPRDRFLYAFRLGDLASKFDRDLSVLVYQAAFKQAYAGRDDEDAAISLLRLVRSFTNIGEYRLAREIADRVAGIKSTRLPEFSGTPCSIIGYYLILDAALANTNPKLYKRLFGSGGSPAMIGLFSYRE
jgi:hypothetical protein